MAKKSRSRILISANYSELRQHRSRVAQALREAGFSFETRDARSVMWAARTGSMWRYLCQGLGKKDS
jgi:hypothetical protein